PASGSMSSPTYEASFSRLHKNLDRLLMYVKKDKEKDELKLLCQDLMDVYNMEQISIKKWEAKTI
ncbi:hypothetical protein, partial [Brevibacillus agri]|uniref:hypothetical protein n=1 Tax=Brevibacillus agri TaxID=51101 RepID=UPI0028682F19